MGYCFFCDRVVDGDTCPTCGRPAWHDDTAGPPASHTVTSLLPEPVEDSPPWRPPPWMIASTVVVVGLVLSILTVPSVFQQVTTPTPPPVTATTTTTLSPGPSLPPYPLPRGTWLGLVRADAPPKTLTGSLPFLEPADDVMYDGSLLLHTGDSYVRVTPDGVHTDLAIGSPGHLVDVELSPNGRLLATVDIHGTVTVWDLTTNQPTELEAADGADPLIDGHIYWSPNSQVVGLDAAGDHCYEWYVDGTLFAGPLPGRLIAVGSLQVAIAGADGLNLTTTVYAQDGTTSGLGRTIATLSDIQAGAFDPTGRYLAVDATIAGQGSGVWVVALGDPHEDLVAPTGSSFTWSGDGSALYWTDATGTYAYPVSSAYRVSSVSSQQLHPGDHLRVYDPVLVAAPTFLVHSGDLFELRGGLIAHRFASGLTQVDPPSGGTTVSIVNATSLDPDLPLLRTARYDNNDAAALLLNTTGLIEDLTGNLPSGADRVVSVLDAPDVGVFLGSDEGEVFRVGPDHTLGKVMEGRSPGIIGTVPFAVTDTSIERLPREGELPETLFDASGLAGAGTLIDAIGIRSEMVVLARTLVGTAAVYWIPGDSDLFGKAILPNSPLPSTTPFSLVYTPTNTTFETGWIVDARDGQTFAVALGYSDGIETVLMSDPAPGQPTCGAIVCQLGSLTGRPLGFSPNGEWLLVDTGGSYVAMSTRGRGYVLFDEPPPDGVVWIP
ncbi:MAG: hypothetical protein WAM81_09450 [Acidimicrobiia bacterium]